MLNNVQYWTEILLFTPLLYDGNTLQLYAKGDENMSARKEKIYLGQMIKNKRLEKKLTQKDVAQKVGLSRNYISDIENGRYMPSVETLIKIARFLKLDLNFLQDPEQSA